MNQEEEKPIRRAFCLTVVMDADTKKYLVSALYNFAIQIDREEITTGVSGGVCSGAIYELLYNSSQTHETYFERIRTRLKSIGE